MTILGLQMWVFCRVSMCAVFIWELTFIPELPWDAWAHHLYVIIFVIGTTDERLMSSSFPGAQPLADGMGIFMVIGASLSFPVEATVVGYHLDSQNPKRQANWM